MPRRAREKSLSGIYHIILRGVKKQEIFHEDRDYQRFLLILEKYARKTGVKVYGWCLMDNHVHLLLAEGLEDISVTMKRIGVSFVWYYNWKYETTGHLFQDRFRSEKVERDEYLLAVIRYIHQNPVKAGIVKQAEDWKWSSCNSYYGKSSLSTELLDSGLILGLFSSNKPLARARFKEFNEVNNLDKCMDDESWLRKNDEEAKQIIKNHLNGIELTQVQNLPKVERNEIFRKVKDIEGVSQRQAARIFGVSTNLIFKA